MTENSSNTVQSTSTQQSFADEPETLGKHLKRTRLSQHKTIDEAAEATRIHASTLEALEEDDRSKLPAEVFTRGFIKIYAGYLGIDQHDALRWYDQKGNIQWPESDEKINAQEVLSTETLAESPNLFGGHKIFLIVTAIFVVFFGYLLYQTYQSAQVPLDEPARSAAEEPPSAVSPTTPDDTAETILPQEEPPASDQEMDTSDAALSLQTETALDDAEETKPPEAEQQPKAVAPPQAEDAPKIGEEAASSAVHQNAQESRPELPAEKEADDAPAEPPPQKTAEGDKADIAATEPAAAAPPPAVSAGESSASDKPYNYILEAQFTEVTWVRVQVDGQRPREFTYQPGASPVWRAKEKIELFIGNAGGVALTLNDEPLPTLGNSGQIYKLSIPTTPTP